MGDLKPSDVVDMFNNHVRGPADSGIRWGSGSYPPDRSGALANEYRSLFTGSTSGVQQTPAATNFKGDVDNDHLRRVMLDYASRYTVIRMVRVYVRYRVNKQTGSRNNSRVGATQYEVVANQTALGHLNASYRFAPRDPNVVHNVGNPTGRDAGYKPTEDWFKEMYGFMRQTRESPVNFERELCHSSCHSSCHSRCHGESPGTGDGSDR